MKYITIRIPVIDTGHTAEQKRIKMNEEIDELLNEFASGPVDVRNALEEFHDVAQVMFGYLLADNKSRLPAKAALSHTELQMILGSARHAHKMVNRAKERGWEVVE